ncbi:hypothetical protein [Saccharospirillum impatiens]|uniref:hypothetical protein n=1 Tax=Saccharospirillum impatiens TaxID=169438 RepID=UPI0003F83F01|nr:hypothetical protein [Saccharospirillum impatiens]
MSNSEAGFTTRFLLVLSFTAMFITGHALADPMRPDTLRPEPQTAPAPVVQPEPTFRLTSIYRLDQQAYAVINGQWLSVNDTLNNYQLMAIRSDRVLLQRGNRTRTLTLQQAGTLAITPTDEE